MRSRQIVCRNRTISDSRTPYKNHVPRAAGGACASQPRSRRARGGPRTQNLRSRGSPQFQSRSVASCRAGAPSPAHRTPRRGYTRRHTTPRLATCQTSSFEMGARPDREPDSGPQSFSVVVDAADCFCCWIAIMVMSELTDWALCTSHILIRFFPSGMQSASQKVIWNPCCRYLLRFVGISRRTPAH